MSLQYMTSRGQASPWPDQYSWMPSPLSVLTSPPLSSSVPQSVSMSLYLSFCVTRLHSSLHSADTFTTFWWVGPAGRWASPSGVVTGGVGMLMIAVVIWLLWQFRGAGSSTRMFRLERLWEKINVRLRIVCLVEKHLDRQVTSCPRPVLVEGKRMISSDIYCSRSRLLSLFP